MLNIVDYIVLLYFERVLYCFYYLFISLLHTFCLILYLKVSIECIKIQLLITMCSLIPLFVITLLFVRINKNY